MDENPANEQLLILSLDNWEAEIPTDVHIATTIQNPRRHNSETDNPKKLSNFCTLRVKKHNNLLGGSSFQVNLRSSVSRFSLQLFCGILSFFVDDDDDDEDFVVGWWLNADGID